MNSRETYFAYTHSVTDIGATRCELDSQEPHLITIKKGSSRNVNELNCAIWKHPKFAATQLMPTTILCTQYQLMREITLGSASISVAEFATKLRFVFKWLRHEDVDGWDLDGEA